MTTKLSDLFQVIDTMPEISLLEEIEQDDERNEQATISVIKGEITFTKYKKIIQRKDTASLLMFKRVVKSLYLRGIIQIK